MNKVLLILLRELEDIKEIFLDDGFAIGRHGWPTGVVSFQQDSGWTLQAVDEHGDDLMELEFDGLPYMGEYDDRQNEITQEEFVAFLEANPNWKEELDKLAETNMARIAELNKQVAALVNEMSDLAEAAGLDLTVDVGRHGGFDPYGSAWNSSNC